MTSYILKNIEEEQEVLLYQEQVYHSFTPKSKKIEKITMLDVDALNKIWQERIATDYDRLIKIIYSLISSDDTTSGDVLIAYTEINRIKEYLLSLESKGLEHDFIDRYLKKLYVLELELKKVHVMELTEEIEQRGHAR